MCTYIYTKTDKHAPTHMYIYIYMLDIDKIKLGSFVEGETKANFAIATNTKV